MKLIGVPVRYRPPSTHDHLPEIMAGLITGCLIAKPHPDAPDAFSLVVFPPNSSPEHVDVAVWGPGHGQFLYAGQDAPKERKAKATPTETQQAPASPDAAASAASAPPAGEDGPPPADAAPANGGAP